jgi:hypothetical protein
LKLCRSTLRIQECVHGGERIAHNFPVTLRHMDKSARRIRQNIAERL